MPVINVADLDRDFQATARNDKLQVQEQDRRARMKFRLPKTIVASHNIPKTRMPQPPSLPTPPPPPEPQVELDPVTKLNVQTSVRSVCLTGLSQPIKKEKRTALRMNLEHNEIITTYIDDKVSSSILGILGTASREVSFLLNYGTEYLRAYNGDQRRPELVNNITCEPANDAPVPVDPQASPEDLMSAALLTGHKTRRQVKKNDATATTKRSKRRWWSCATSPSSFGRTSRSSSRPSLTLRTKLDGCAKDHSRASESESKLRLAVTTLRAERKNLQNEVERKKCPKKSGKRAIGPTRGCLSALPPLISSSID
jgi:hypothetical protein